MGIATALHRKLQTGCSQPPQPQSSEHRSCLHEFQHLEAKGTFGAAAQAGRAALPVPCKHCHNSCFDTDDEILKSYTAFACRQNAGLHLGRLHAMGCLLETQRTEKAKKGQDQPRHAWWHHAATCMEWKCRACAASGAQARPSLVRQRSGLSSEAGARRTTTATAVAACAAAEGARLNAAASNSCRMACVLSTRRSAVRQPGGPSLSAAAALHSGSALPGETQPDLRIML